jgi:hypothetical protein
MGKTVSRKSKSRQPPEPPDPPPLDLGQPPHELWRVMLRIKVYLWDVAEQQQSALAWHAAYALSNVWDSFAAGDETALRRVSRYSRIEQLASVARRCDRILTAWACHQQREEGVAKAMRLALSAAASAIPYELPPPASTPTQPSNPQEWAERVSQWAQHSADDLIAHCRLRQIDGHSVVRKALTVLGVGYDTADAMLKPLMRDKKKPAKPEYTMLDIWEEDGVLTGDECLSLELRDYLPAEVMRPIDMKIEQHEGAVIAAYAADLDRRESSSACASSLAAARSPRVPRRRRQKRPIRTNPK